ncbi:MAG: GNAT family N-acetyltransferase [Elusimicrobiota bacterium]
MKLVDFNNALESIVYDVWKQVIPDEYPSETEYTSRVINDPNLDGQGFPVAFDDNGKVIGFAISIIRKVPNDGLGLEPDRGWVTMVGVLPECRRKGVGIKLINCCEKYIKSHGHKNVYVCGSTGSSPNYFWPGVDIQKYPAALGLFKKAGFIQTHEAYRMERSLDDYVFPADVNNIEDSIGKTQGITVRLMQSGEGEKLIKFLEHEFPGDWVRHTGIVLSQKQGNEKRFFIAEKNGEFVGYCHYDDTDGHFGPFFVRADMRNHNIGAVLFNRCAQRCKGLGLPVFWFGWADDPVPARFYKRNKMKITRTYAMLKKEL